jgi:prepilin-type N-terminal cleavage/methylation domain-containing protein
VADGHTQQQLADGNRGGDAVTARLRAALRRRFDRPDDGFTLIELMVAMTVLSFVLAILTYAVASSLAGERGVAVRTNDAMTGRVAVDRMSSLLSEAIDLNDNATSPFTSATTSSVSFYSNVYTLASGASAVSKGPLGVTLWEGTNTTSCKSPDYCLFETDTPTVSGTITVSGTSETAWVAGSSSTTRVLAHGVSQSPSQQLFTFYQTTTCNPATDSTCNAASPRRTVTQISTDATGAVSSSNYSSIDTVDLFLAVDNQSSPDAPATSIENRVSMAGAQSGSTSAATS